MEYVNERGSFHDVPVDDILQAWQAVYGAERVRRWVALYDAAAGRPVRDSGTEDVIGDAE